MRGVGVYNTLFECVLMRDTFVKCWLITNTECPTYALAWGREAVGVLFQHIYCIVGSACLPNNTTVGTHIQQYTTGLSTSQAPINRFTSMLTVHLNAPLLTECNRILYQSTVSFFGSSVIGRMYGIHMVYIIQQNVYLQVP